MQDTMLLIASRLGMQLATTSMFFRNTFSTDAASDPSGTDKAFHSLYEMVVVGGSAVYQSVAIICWILCGVALIVAGVSYASTTSHNDRFMQKSSITRVALIIAFLGGVLGFVNLMFQLFA